MSSFKLGPIRGHLSESALVTSMVIITLRVMQAQEEAEASNASRAESESLMFPLYMRILATVACLLIFSVGVAGNLLVPLVVIKTKYLRNSTNLFLINLSIADLLVLLVCMPTMIIELHSRPETWLLGESMCKYLSTCCQNSPLI